MTLKINQVKLTDVSLTCTPTMLHFESKRDYLKGFSYSFTESNSYGVIGNLGDGGWALSYLLSGKTKKYKGSMFVNDELPNNCLIEQYGWYVGEDLSTRRGMFGKRNKMTIRQQLESANSSKYTISELIDLFELAPSRLDRTIEYISNERWNASIAIGLAQEKKIFCFPWLDDFWKDAIRVRLEDCSNILKKNNCILLIPVLSPSIIEDFVDELVFLNK